MRTLLFTLLFFVATSTQAQRREMDRDRLPQPVSPQHPQLIDLYWKAWEEAWKRMDTIQQWNAPFSTLFCKYAPYFFPAEKQLDPLYGESSPYPLAWLEWEYHCLSGDNDRMRKLVCTSSLPDSGEETLSLGSIARQALSALCIARQAEALELREVAKKHLRQYEYLKQTVNKKYWDDSGDTYCEAPAGNEAAARATPSSVFWVMLAEIPSPKQNEHLLKGLFGEGEAAFSPDWDTSEPTLEIQTIYLAVKALNKAGYTKQAGLLAQQYVRNYEIPLRTPTDLVMPISFFIEDILGFYRIDAANRIVEWQKEPSGLSGIKNLTFGTISTDILGDDYLIRVESNETYTLIVNGRSHRVRRGSNTFKTK